jgi:hypothetical protein
VGRVVVQYLNGFLDRVGFLSRFRRTKEISLNDNLYYVRDNCQVGWNLIILFGFHSIYSCALTAKYRTTAFDSKAYLVSNFLCTGQGIYVILLWLELDTFYLKIFFLLKQCHVLFLTKTTITLGTNR